MLALFEFVGTNITPIILFSGEIDTVEWTSTDIIAAIRFRADLIFLVV